MFVKNINLLAYSQWDDEIYISEKKLYFYNTEVNEIFEWTGIYSFNIEFNLLSRLLSNLQTWSAFNILFESYWQIYSINLHN